MEKGKYHKAKRRVNAAKGFYAHLASWIIFSVFFVILNLLTSPNEFWAMFPIMGWGIGVAFHAIGVFGFPGLGKDWEERMLEREIHRIDREEELREWNESNTRRDLEAPEHYPTDEEPLKLKELTKDPEESDYV